MRSEHLIQSINEFSCDYNPDEITASQLKQLEKSLDKLFAGLGVDIEFTRHFLDRVNDKRNKKQISVCELANIFKEVYKKFGVKISKSSGAVERIIKSISTSINMPVALKWNRDSKIVELNAMTVMRKKGFKSPDKVLQVEDIMKTKNIIDSVNEGAVKGDMAMTVVKGQKVIISNGFKSRNYNSDSIIALTLLSPPKQPGRIYNPIVKAFKAKGESAYLNKMQAGPGGAVFIDKSDTLIANFKALLGTDLSPWIDVHFEKKAGW